MIYQNEKLVNSNQLKNIAIDESLFVKDNNWIKIWLIGLTFLYLIELGKYIIFDIKAVLHRWFAYQLIT